MRKYIVGALLLLSSCGYQSDSYSNNPTPPPPADDPAFASVQPVIQRNCGRCHNGTVHPLRFDTAAAFKGSRAKARLTTGTMPPAPNTISAEDKSALLAYLGN